MNITLQERAKLKADLLRVGINEPLVLAEILTEVKQELQQEHPNPLDAQTEALIQEIFTEYAEVFRALA